MNFKERKPKRVDIELILIQSLSVIGIAILSRRRVIREKMNFLDRSHR